MEEPTPRAEATGDSPPDLRIGSYRIVEPLGTGGMSSVYRAVHVDTGHEVAVKVLTRTIARNSTLLQRFLREARSAETLEHPNIVAIYDRGIDNGRHYLVLEYVPGGDFHGYIQRHGPLSADEAVMVARSVARGLEHAATRGLIHRDIKPSNLLRKSSGEAKIIDLGLALQTEFEDERVTREGTTVGTVDYMAPEQARDSRATSIQSDIYSLGCTLYYLLTGVPPYPGGDITDKLTRHARAAVPDIRDLRPDISPALATILLRMMAKHPDDRYADYGELLNALDAVPRQGPDSGPAILLVPLDDASEASDPLGIPVRPPSWPAAPASSPDSGAAPLPWDSLPGLVDEPSGDFAADVPRAAPITAPAPLPLPRLGRTVSPEADEAAVEEALPSAIEPQARRSTRTLVLSSLAIGLAFVLIVIGAYAYRARSDGPGAGEGDLADPRTVDTDQPHLVRILPSSPAASGPRNRTGPRAGSGGPHRRVPAAEARPEPWVEPEDNAPVPGEDRGSTGTPDRRHQLPEWARAPFAARPDGPLVVVRRVAEAADTSPPTVPTLEMALDRAPYIGGTVEVADEGPLPVDELRVAGDSRLIRARPGFRPIVRIERAGTEAARQRTALMPLDRKNVTLEGIDLVVDVTELSSRQTALFGCLGSSLSLRDCTITIVNPRRAPFAVIRAESAAARPCRVRLERTLIRGWFGAAADLPAAQVDLVVDRCAILGGTGALIRIAGSESAAASATRIDLVDSVLAGPGPIVARAREAAGSPIRPVVVRAFGTAFARWNGPGIASVIASASPVWRADQQVDWAGDGNLYAGWKGFFARGSDPTVVVGDLAAVRSTWNGTDPNSQEILLPWPQPPDPAEVTPEFIRPFLPDRTASLGQAAGTPRAGLFEKTIGSYLGPVVPQPRGWALDARPEPREGGSVRSRFAPGVRVIDDSPKAAPVYPPPRAAELPGGVRELVMNTADPNWNGDLGAFLRDRVDPSWPSARVRVEGSGARTFTPVRLPPGLHLEIRVERTPGLEPPSWTSDPQATGPGLIELHGGALVLAGVVLRHDPSSRLESLIAAEDGDLVLFHCQFTVPPGSGTAGGLIAFRASTRTKPSDPRSPLFQPAVDRPVCRLIESTLIANGTAVRAELGRGLIALSQTAVAAGETALDLIPSRVARSRFGADLVLEESTIAAERSVIRLGPWPGLPPGPDRPWLVTSKSSAFLSLSDRRPRETVMVRADADALARGTLFWESAGDALEVDLLMAAGDAPVSPSKVRDIPFQWAHFWGPNHVRGLVAAPRGAGGLPSIRPRNPLRAGRIEPADLFLEMPYPPGPGQARVGADLARQGIAPRPPRAGQRRG
jgi:serine/threonine-protein kinase